MMEKTRFLIFGLVAWIFLAISCNPPPTIPPRDTTGSMVELHEAVEADSMAVHVWDTNGIFPIVRESEADICVAGVVLGDKLENIEAQLARKEKKLLRVSQNRLEFEGSLTVSKWIEATTLYFFNKELYKVMLMLDSSRDKSLEVYHQLRAKLEAKYGAPDIDDQAGIGTIESAEWNGRYDGNVDIRAVWVEDDRLTSLEYQYNLVYTKLIKSLSR